MRDVAFTESVAQRKLVLRRPDGSAVDVMLEIGRPVPFPANPLDFACPIRIVGLDREEKIYQVGVDSAQALMLAFMILPSWLQITASIHGGSFESWGVPGHGFPEWPRDAGA